jgi:hypothetical protein
MRLVFSLAGLLVVVFIVMSLAKRQMQELAPSAAGPASASAAGAQQMQEQVRTEIRNALGQGLQRRASESGP